MNKKPLLRVIIGPTASGKTDFAIQLAKEKNGSVISADSRQVYVGMDIGTAKVRDTRYQISDIRTRPHDVLMADVVEEVPHYLLNIREPSDPMTLSEWQAAAYKAIDYVIAHGQAPLLVGGTMLYVDSIVFNYQIPNVEPSPALRAELEKRTTAELWQQLIAKDPQARGFIEPHHKQRIIRALEVIEATGKPFSDVRRKREPRYEIEMIGLFPHPASAPGFGEAKAAFAQGFGGPQWDELKSRIEKRVHEMLTQGLIEETKQLQEKYGKDLPLLQTMNYKQAAAVLAEEMTEAEAIEDMVRVNMRYARRQMSWWKGRKEIRWE